MQTDSCLPHWPGCPGPLWVPNPGAAEELSSCHQDLEMVLSFPCAWIGYVLFILHPGAFNYSQQVPFTLGKSCSNFSLNYFL